MKLGRMQWIALGASGVAAVMLAMAPRTPAPEAGTHPPSTADARLAEAVALVNGENPMMGIQQLLAIVEEDPSNVEAHWHLGLFSVQSGQYPKALERFRKVADMGGDRIPDVWFYLGRTYATMDSTEQAILSLKHYRTLTQDTAILRGVDRFLLELEHEKP